MTKAPAVSRSVGACLLALGLASWAGEGAASDCPPVSSDRYRSLPEESEVAFAALAHYLHEHPPEGRALLCLTMPGYKPIPARLAKRLATPSLVVDPDVNCRFQRGRLVQGTEGVWQLKDGRYVADVSLLEFDDISLSRGTVRYTVARAVGGFSIQSQIRCQP